MVLPLASLIGCIRTEVTCRGVCPAPDAGVVVDDEVVEKSIWLTEGRLGSPDGIGRSLCGVQVNNTREEEILFRGTDGVLIITPDRGLSGGMVPDPLLLQYLDFAQ